MMKQFAVLLMSCALSVGCASRQDVSNAATTIPLPSKSPDQAVASLKEGNERFVSNKGIWKNYENSQLEKQVDGQNPYAMIISCADSRVPVEHIFDAGFGEVFVMRVAGNVATSEIIGSSEYAALALKTPVMLVLGHSSCGAVAGSLAIDGLDKKYPDDLQELLEGIREDVVENGVEPSTNVCPSCC